MTGDVSNRQLAENALAGALERWHAADQRSADPDAIYACTGEALWWVTALEDWHRDNTPGYAEDVYASVPDRRLILGHRYARNHIGHGLVAVQKATGGFGFPMRFPLKFSEFVWRDLPLSPKDERHLDQRRAYNDTLVGQMVRNTLASAQRFLLAL